MGKAGDVVINILTAIGQAMAEAQKRQHLMDAFGSEEWMRKHAPQQLEMMYETTWLGPKIRDAATIDLVVLSVDIRKSTALMKEAIAPEAFAQTVNEFVQFAQGTVRTEQGWFDKFMGDGFLAYWVCNDQTRHVAILRSLRVAHMVQTHFRMTSRPKFIENARNWPTGIGLACGLDAGPGHMIMTGDGPTIMGLPVVGAVRMQSAAQSSEILSNVHYGQHLERLADDWIPEGTVNQSFEQRDTKEFVHQWVRRLTTTDALLDVSVPRWEKVGAAQADIPASTVMRQNP